MLKSASAILATLALFATPALADHHGNKDKYEKHHGMKSMMMNDDGEKLSRDEFVARATERFEAADTSAEGELTMEEFVTYMEAERERRREEMQKKMFSTIDTNGDGVISADEHAAHAGNMYDRMENWKDKKRGYKDGKDGE